MSDNQTMNIYKKMNAIKTELRNTKLTKTGKNDYNGQEYFQLSDFLDVIQDLCDKYDVNTAVSFPNGIAQMVITNVDNPKEIMVVESPFGSASLKGCHEVQNIGATETYQRRYLYIAAFDIIENDMIDSTIAITLDPDIKRIQKCQTIEELSGVWAELYKLHKSDKEAVAVLTKEKDLMKETLQLGSNV